VDGKSASGERQVAGGIRQVLLYSSFQAIFTSENIFHQLIHDGRHMCFHGNHRINMVQEITSSSTYKVVSA